MKPEARIQRVVHSQLSWRLCNKEVEAYVTELGGHLGPVTFQLKGKPAQPFSVAPWVDEPVDPALPPLLQVLRGDFFCLPFGGNAAPYRGEQHPPHGETANRKWSFESFETQGRRTSLSLRLRTKARPGRVDKTIVLVEGHTAVHCRHTVSGMAGAMSFGHHPMLKFPETPGSGVITTSPFVHGQVFPGAFELPENSGYSFLKPGAEFDNLERVPALNGGVADLSRYPARRGFEDLVLMISDTRLPFAWTAVTFPKQRQVWFSLKDPRLLRATIFWISNSGRYYGPWNGRHRNVMGLEDVTSFFHLGLAESARKNAAVPAGVSDGHATERPKTIGGSLYHGHGGIARRVRPGGIHRGWRGQGHARVDRPEWQARAGQGCPGFPAPGGRGGGLRDYLGDRSRDSGPGCRWWFGLFLVTGSSKILLTR